MRYTATLFSARGHNPLIRFLGKRTWPSGPESPHPHPAAPTEIQKRFAEFTKSSAWSSSADSQNTSKNIHSEFWDAPTRFWRPKVRELEDAEIDVIMSGGAAT